MAAGDDRKATVSFAVVEPDGMEFDELVGALVGGTRTATYGRTWVMTEPHVNGDYVHGRIGIVTDVEQWDEESHEFHPGTIEAGYATPYLLHLPTRRLVFQTRGSLIKAQSFVNAFEHLLEATDAATTWRVRLAERDMDWADFLASVERIEKMSIRMERPNPRFRSDLAEALVSDTESASATVTLRADENGSVDSDSEVVEQLMAHAEAYGNTTATGTYGAGGRITWRSRRRRARVAAPAPADPTTGEVAPADLQVQLDQWSSIPFFPTDE